MRRNEDERGEEEEMGMRVEREGKKEGGGRGESEGIDYLLVTATKKSF